MRQLLWMVLLISAVACKDNSKETQSQVVRQQHSPQMKESIDRGVKIYSNFCASCHLSSGEGIKGVFPPLKDSDWLTKKPTESIHAIKYGLRGPIKVNGDPYDNLMPALGLSDQEIADVMNYINNAWGNNISKPVTEEDVAAIEK